MIDSRIKLTVFKDSNGSFFDHSEDACDFSRDDFSMTLNSSTDYLYVGFRKPIGGVYVELTTPNTNINTIGASYYNGSSWVSLDIRDETKGFTRSGYISFDRSVLGSTTVNAETLYWVRFRPSVTHSATVVRGINLVLSDDASLKAHFPEIDNESLIPVGHASHIMAHQAARDEIIQDLRKRGHIKTSVATGTETIDQWDLLDIYQIRQAATYKALANIFFSLADNPQDKWYGQYIKYSGLYESEINAINLSIDEDDDGIQDENEKDTKVRYARLVY